MIVVMSVRNRHLGSPCEERHSLPLDSLSPPLDGGGRGGGERLLQLQIVNRLVESTQQEQFLMLAALDDAAVFHDKNQVRAANGGQAMRNHKGRAAFHQVVQGLLDQFLRLRVNRGGRVIQDKDAGIHQQGACDGHPLALSAAERHAALADDGLITVGEVEDKLMRLRSLGGGDDFLVAGLRPAVGDVGLDRVGEKERGLQDDADPAAQRDRDPSSGRPSRPRALRPPSHHRSAGSG